MRRPFLALQLLVALAPIRASSAQQSAPALPTIIGRYLDARGGIEKIRSVRSIIFRGPPRADGRPGRWMAKARPYYWLVGEPSPTRDFAEGFDGSHWEYYRSPGLVMRTSGEPAAAGRHTAYFDDALVYFGEPGWTHDLLGAGQGAGEEVYWIRATFPDGFMRDYAVSQRTWLIVATRWSAPLHAVGEPIKTETRVLDYRPLNGALFPMRMVDYDLTTGQPIEPGPGWASADVNVELPLDYFAPPAEPKDPLARMVNAIYASREFIADVLLWYRDFRANRSTASIDTENAIESVAFQILKSGHVATSIALLEANLRDYAKSAAAHFHLGRAYRSAGREVEAIARFQEALKIDPNYTRAAEALKR